MEATTSEYIKVKNSKIHGTGIYAVKDIPKDAYILEYVGHKVTKKESDRLADLQYERGETKSVDEGHVYIFTLNRNFDINGNVEWNTARFINHSCNPNAEAVNDEGHIWIQATKKIKEGDEITYNYGYDVDNYIEHPCLCGSKNCIGYIVDESQWPKLKKKIAKAKLSK